MALLPSRWGYAILDEGHRIRNPDAEVTLMSKQLQTVHRCASCGCRWTEPKEHYPIDRCSIR